jgi:mRNA interferase HigB
LRNWFKTASTSTFHSFAEVKEIFGSVDEVDGFHVFNIGGNKTRLIAKIRFQYQGIYIHSILTHAEYSKGKWKL